MIYEMPALNYSVNALQPVISEETINFHYGKHLQTYVTNLNNLVPGTAFEGKSLEEIVATAPDGPIFNNAGQVLNHTLYFLQFAPKPQSCEPMGKLAEAITKEWGSLKRSKKSSRQLLSDYLVRVGHGCRPTKMANYKSLKRLMAVIHFAMD